VQQGEARLQVLPPAPAPQGPATHQRKEPPRTQECSSTTDATANTTRTDSYRSKLLQMLPGQTINYSKYYPDRSLPW
jgi:hypothetical protein